MDKETIGGNRNIERGKAVAANAQGVKKKRLDCKGGVKWTEGGEMSRKKNATRREKTDGITIQKSRLSSLGGEGDPRVKCQKKKGGLVAKWGGGHGGNEV